MENRKMLEHFCRRYAEMAIMFDGVGVPLQRYLDNRVSADCAASEFISTLDLEREPFDAESAFLEIIERSKKRQSLDVLRGFPS